LQLDEKAGKYKGIWDCGKQTVIEHGPRGLYRGLPVLLLGSIPKSAVRFGAFEFFKELCVDENGNLSGGRRLLCGLGAGISEAILAVTPMETVKVKFIADRRLENPQYRNLFHGVKTIVAAEGIAGTYKGLTATMMKQGSNQAIRFYVMETCKNWYREGDPTKPVPKLVVGVFGGFAGACSVMGNTPLDVIKTRMQSLDAAKYKNTWDCAKTIMVNEGPRAFYKGTMPRMSRVVLDVGITFMIYDSFMDLFNKVWP
jgi:solute carrier family 25 citrate transporter 1